MHSVRHARLRHGVNMEKHRWSSRVSGSQLHSNFSGIVVYFYNSDALKLLERRPMCSLFCS